MAQHVPRRLYAEAIREIKQHLDIASPDVAAETTLAHLEGAAEILRELIWDMDQGTPRALPRRYVTP